MCKKNFNIWVLALALWAMVPITVYAQAPQVDCGEVKPYAGELFDDFYQRTRQVSTRFCDIWVEAGINAKSTDMTFFNNQARALLVEFAEAARDALDARSLDEAADYEAQFSKLEAQYRGFEFQDMQFPEFRVRSAVLEDKVEGWFSALEDAPLRFLIKEIDHCRTSLGMSCQMAFEEFGQAFNPYRSAYNNAYQNQALLEDLSRRWDRFLEVSKSQTFIEVWLTTLYHRNHFKKDHLVGPPDSQVIALHPHLIYSDASAAADGDNQEIGLAVEWIGLNFWDWPVPLGFSYTTTYVDRAGFDDTGQGVMLHINNHYAIGWAEHGEEDTYYFTIDLLKMLQDKERQYRSYIDQYLN